MLSLTYTQAALKVEQDGVRELLNSLQQCLQEKYKHNLAWSRDDMEYLLCKVKHVHVNCRWRRLEVLFWPEIRDAATNAKPLMSELESLRLLGLDLYRSVRDRLRMAINGEFTDKHALYRSLEMYCHTLMGLLDREEQEFFGLAFDLMPEDRWFSIAKKFMCHDRNMLECGGLGEILQKSRTDLQSQSSINPKEVLPDSDLAQPCARYADTPDSRHERNSSRNRADEDGNSRKFRATRAR